MHCVCTFLPMLWGWHFPLRGIFSSVFPLASQMTHMQGPTKRTWENVSEALEVASISVWVQACTQTQIHTSSWCGLRHLSPPCPPTPPPSIITSAHPSAPSKHAGYMRRDAACEDMSSWLIFSKELKSLISSDPARPPPHSKIPMLLCGCDHRTH